MRNLFHSWFKSFLSCFANPVSRGRPLPHRSRDRQVRLSVEQLEDRMVPTTFNVNSLADLSIAAGVNPKTGAILGQGNIVTLRSAIDAANMTPGGNTINLLVPGTYTVALPGANTDTDASGAFTILPGGGNLSIVNASHGAVTVDGNHLDRVFDINPTFNPASPTAPFTVTLTGFTITNGVASPGDGPAGSGGGIRDQGNASLVLNSVVVTGNMATADGGGISMENTVSEPWTLTINSSTISNNHAGDAGGGVEEDGSGKVFVNAGTVITGNTCVNQGAGIWLDAINPGSVGSVTITNPGTATFGPLLGFPAVHFTSVDGQGSGAQGSIVVNNLGAPIGVNITNPGSGYDMPPTVSFSFQFFTPDITAVATLAPLQTATLDVTGAVISNNDALNGPGGGIGNSGASAVTITSSTIENNSSGNNGGGFGDQNNQGTLVVVASLIANNVAVGQGGGIQEAGPNTTITSSEITGNSSGNSGSGVFAGGTTLFVQGSTIANNIASGDGNGLGGGGIELQTTGTGLRASTITDTTITGNRALNNAGANGGGIDAQNLTGDLVLVNDTINGNFASAGGGIDWQGSADTVEVQNTILAGNIAALGVDAANGSFAFTDLGGNLIGVAGDNNTGFTAGTTQTGTLTAPLNPLLAPLGNNAGPTIGAPGTTMVLQTEALQTGSLAIGQGVFMGAPAFDERGVQHLLTSTINVGAVSAVVPLPPPPVTHVTTTLPLVSAKTVNGVTTTTYNVTTTADNLNAPSSGSLSLREAIKLANTTPGNKVIQLLVAGDYKITIPGANTGSDASGAFAILPSGGNVTILNASGGAATVDGNHLDRVFDINPADDLDFNDAFTVTLQGITITNGVASPGDGAAGSGGGIRDQGIASLTLNNVTLTNNVATADGGGLSMENTVCAAWTLTSNASTISNNHAGDAGGGVETDGWGKVFINAGTVITGNTAVNQGAGIWLDTINPGVASVTVTSPGLVNFVSPPPVSFISVDGNGSGAQGTAVLRGGQVVGVTITNPGSGYDKPPTVSIPGGVTAVATLAPFPSALLSVTGTLISNNASLDMLGGGIGNAGNGAVTITSSTIENNFSAGTGGGFADANNQGSLTVLTSLFQNNVAVGVGGGIQEGGPTTSITSSQIQGNVSGNTGGGLFANGIALTVKQSTIAFNTASGDGNGLGGGGIELQTTGSASIMDTTITGNRALNNAGANGGGIDATKVISGAVTVNDTINANFASNGGGIFWGAIPQTGGWLLQNTIVAQNFIANGGRGVDAFNPDGEFTGDDALLGIAGDANMLFGTNLTGTLARPLNPLLGPLGYNGGPLLGAPGATLFLQTEALLTGSPALGKGDKNGAPAADERGVANDTIFSIGAVNV